VRNKNVLRYLKCKYPNYEVEIPDYIDSWLRERPQNGHLIMLRRAMVLQLTAEELKKLRDFMDGIDY